MGGGNALFSPRTPPPYPDSALLHGTRPLSALAALLETKKGREQMENRGNKPFTRQEKKYL